MKVGKEEDDQQAALWLLAKKEHYRYNVCFVSVFVALEKAYNRVAKKRSWYCMRKDGESGDRYNL